MFRKTSDVRFGRLAASAPLARCRRYTFVCDPLPFGWRDFAFRLFRTQTVFLAFKGSFDRTRRSNSFTRLSDTPNNLAVSSTVGYGPLRVIGLGFTQPSALNITSLRRYFLPPLSTLFAGHSHPTVLISSTDSPKHAVAISPATAISNPSSTAP
jgi:hypothetical protein